MKTISIIRNRGQLTIPDSIRKAVSWAGPMSAVSIIVVNPNEIVIKPHQAQINWDKTWADIKKARSIKGRGGNLAQFIAKDRNSH